MTPTPSRPPSATWACANGVLFVNLDRIESAYLGDLDGDTRAAVESLRAVGASTRVTGDGEASFSLRVVGN